LCESNEKKRGGIYLTPITKNRKRKPLAVISLSATFAVIIIGPRPNNITPTDIVVSGWCRSDRYFYRVVSCWIVPYSKREDKKLKSTPAQRFFRYFTASF
jgi:hypothetical protein